MSHSLKEPVGKWSFADVSHWLASSVAYVVREIANRHQQWRANAELERLDRRLLTDVGISITEILASRLPQPRRKPRVAIA